MRQDSKIPRLKRSVEMRPFKDGFLITHTSYMWVEKAMREAEIRSGVAYFYKYASCCVCRRKGASTHEAVISNAHLYIPVCRRCENFMWGTHGRKPYARIYSTAFETNRRKY